MKDFRPDERPVLNTTLTPAFGMVTLVREDVLSDTHELPASYEERMEETAMPGVTVTWLYEYTADPAGLMLIVPKSPPNAVTALPKATVLAVPK